MAHGNTIFLQILKLVPRHEFETLEISTIMVVRSVPPPDGRNS